VLVLPAFRDHAWQSLDVVDTLAETSPDLPVLLSGWGAEPAYVDAIRAGVPIRHPRFRLARGEVEAWLVDAIERLVTVGDDRNGLAATGLAVPNPQGGWLSRGRFRVAEDLARLPSPYLSGEMGPADAGGLVLVEVARGCLFRCHFCLSCNYPMQMARPFPIARICAEIDYAADHGAAGVGLPCSGLNYDVEVLEAVADTLESIPPQRRPRVESTVHASLLDDRRLAATRRSPWGRMIVGLQSIHPHARALMHRNVDVFAFRDAIERISEFPTPTVELILGLPGDTLVGFATTLKYALALPAAIEVYPLRLDPGTPFFEQRQALGLDADFAQQGRVLGTPTFPPRDRARAVEILHEVAHRSWTHRARRLGFDFKILFDPTGVAPDLVRQRAIASRRSGD